MVLDPHLKVSVKTLYNGPRARYNDQEVLEP